MELIVVDGNTPIPSQQWEGKMQDGTGNTVIGVRLWNPELAMWLSPVKWIPKFGQEV